MSRIRCWQVDAFTDVPFRGNPAAVCWLEREAKPAWMQAVAAEMNLAETAFVRRVPDAASNELELRWFTPTVEVDLCGHATLAAAHVLWNAEILPAAQAIRFSTRSGWLTCAREESSDGSPWITLDFPATPATAASAPESLATALGATPTQVLQSKFDYLAVFDSPAAIRSLRPDFALLGKIPVRGVMVTSPADDPKLDFISRFFGPAAGINEDPVTGSAHCCLGPYWSQQLGKNELVAYQASSRGGTVRMRIAGERVILSGQAVTVWQGELL